MNRRNLNKRIGILIALAVVSSVAFMSCRTTEANYRKAYEKAIEGKSEAIPLDSTIYVKHKRIEEKTYVNYEGDTIEIHPNRVTVVSGENVPAEVLKTYSVVAGQFKQLFNARSLRDRLKTKGYPDAFLIANAEPYYYIVIGSYDDPRDAQAVLKKLEEDKPVVMKTPLPYILKKVN